MIYVKSVTINKFRSFHPGTCFDLGRGVTLIAGLNGTSKSTLLGMICQPIGYPTTDKKSIYTDAYKEVSLKVQRTLFGTLFKSAISDVLRFSSVHDKPRQHDYTVRLEADAGLLSDAIIRDGLNVRSEARGGAENDKIRIVTNSDMRDPGAGNFPHPVIYLGLDRLRPLSTVDTVRVSEVSQLTDAEKRIWRSVYSEVMLCSPTENIASGLLDTEKSGKRKYESVQAHNYDGESASAGQDNLGQLITALLSFYRLRSELGEKYQGGVLLIDEIDATLHPFSQAALFQVLIKYAEELKIQIVATTHSLFLLKLASWNFKSHVRLLFLEKHTDGQIYLLDDVAYDDIEYKLSLIRRTVRGEKKDDKTTVLFEDEVAASFFKCVTHNLFKDYVRIYSTRGKKNGAIALANNILASVAKYIAPKKIPEFSEVIYLLDGDSRLLLCKRIKNLMCLPGKYCAEREMYDMLHGGGTEEHAMLLKLGISRDDCFMGFNDIAEDPLLVDDQQRKRKYKEWFNRGQKRGDWGRSCTKIFNQWRGTHGEVCRKFCMEFLNGLNFVRKNRLHKEQQDQLIKKIGMFFPST